MSACQSFRPVAPFIFLTTVAFWGPFFNTEGVWPSKYAYDIPLVVLIYNIYGFVGLPPSFSGKNIIFGYFWIKKVVWPYKCNHDVPLVTMNPKIYRSCSRMNHGHMNSRQTIHFL